MIATYKKNVNLLNLIYYTWSIIGFSFIKNNFYKTEKIFLSFFLSRKILFFLAVDVSFGRFSNDFFESFCEQKHLWLRVSFGFLGLGFYEKLEYHDVCQVHNFFITLPQTGQLSSIISWNIKLKKELRKEDDFDSFFMYKNFSLLTKTNIQWFFFLNTPLLMKTSACKIKLFNWIDKVKSEDNLGDETGTVIKKGSAGYYNMRQIFCFLKNDFIRFKSIVSFFTQNRNRLFNFNIFLYMEFQLLNVITRSHVVSFFHAIHLIREGYIFVNGIRILDTKFMVKIGDVICVKAEQFNGYYARFYYYKNLALEKK